MGHHDFLGFRSRALILGTATEKEIAAREHLSAIRLIAHKGKSTPAHQVRRTRRRREAKMSDQDVVEFRLRQADAAADQRIKTLDEIEKEHIMSVLEKCGGRKGEAAKLLGIDRKTLFRKVKALKPEQNI
ncbi:MAG: hypothetical protein C4520_17180 [Candidatus Abyssobacteria bacterium SURF_5]|jgi:DNA-binding NtrC family response regulator|uniref:DNA binding HTH domain-containing protein n=1 Tax=Abyssobacteria bacterium (strain SURF_5) TaxID=2093360 RepID=A0A3A4NES9_ABYX5|nr:MAG: hypothetical protein C4520_17180 [Candidatus Abyssubacteria bacterium SURF_5]